MSSDVERLSRMKNLILCIWSIELDEMDVQASFSDLQASQTPLSLPALEEDEETEFLSVAPGVWAPQVSVKSQKLTWRGREQVSLIL